MKIYEIQSDNFKKLSVNLLMDGKGVTITGKNGVGKSTFIDAIFTTLTGKEIPDAPIQKGKASAKNTVKIKDDEGNIIVVERSFSSEKNILTVKTSAGAKYSSPQKFLNDTIGNISFDPFEFINQEPRHQKKFIMDLCNLDFTNLEAKKKDLLIQKDSIDKNIITLENELFSDIHPDLSEYQLIKDTTEPLKKVQLAGQIQQVVNNLNNEIRTKNEFINNAGSRIYDIDEQIKKLTGEKENLDIKRNSAAVDRDKFIEELSAIEIPDVSNIEKELQDIEDFNKKVQERIAFQNKENKLEYEKTSLQEVNDSIKKLEQNRIDMIKSVKMPVQNLEFTDDGLLFEGLPLDVNQISKAKLIEIGLKISMALNPKLRIMRIKDGSLFDSEMLAIVRNACKDNDYQLFLEKVTDDSEIGFVLEEGAEK